MAVRSNNISTPSYTLRAEEPSTSIEENTFVNTADAESHATRLVSNKRLSGRVVGNTMRKRGRKSGSTLLYGGDERFKLRTIATKSTYFLLVFP